MSGSNQIYVIKKSGEREIFSSEKVLRSMQRVGVPKDERPRILKEIEKELYPEIKTSEIFSKILNDLGKNNRKASIKLNLKQAIFDFGPTGFPFEKYIAKVFETVGYKTEVDVLMEGECVSHEIDLILEKNSKKDIAEVKFHNEPGVKTDCRVALYTYARFLDVKKGNNINEVWIITNTKLSQDAIKYCLCKGVKTIAWNYPSIGNLQDLVENPKLYPITILESLSSEEKRILLESNIVLCSDLLSLSAENAKSLFFNMERFKRAKEDAQLISDKM